MTPTIPEGFTHGDAMIPTEKLEAVPGWDGYYVSRDGKVFSSIPWRGENWRELTVCANSHGYARVRIGHGGKRWNVCIHKLVAQAFLPPKPSQRHQIRHLDGNRMNPAADNLCWGTAKDNATDREAHGTTASGQRNGQAKITDADARRIYVSA